MLIANKVWIDGILQSADEASEVFAQRVQRGIVNAELRVEPDADPNLPRFERSPSLNDNQDFLQALAALVRSRLEGSR